MDSLGTTLADAARQLYETLAQYLPAILGAVALLIIGWVAARLARALAVRGIQFLEALLERVTRRPVGAGLRSSAPAFGALMFWLVLLFFVAAATQTLGLVTFTQWLARLLEYLPTLAAGLLIIAAGFVLARFVGDIVHATAERLAPAQRATLARLARGATLFVALLVGADQIGIRVTWIAIFLAIAVAAVAGGVVLAVSLGARDYVANLVGAHYLRQTLRLGELVRIGEHEGRVLDVTPTSLVLESVEGRVSLPGRVYHQEAIVVIARTNGGNGDG